MVPLAGSDFYVSHDLLFWPYRLWELDRCLHSGQVFARWFPDFAWGRGMPFLNFYAPLFLYIAEGFHLAGLGLLAALKAGIFLILAGSAVGMYALARQDLRREAALLAGASYLFGPYLLTVVYLRGGLAEGLAFVWMPLCLLSLRAAVVKGGGGAIAFGAASLAALVLTHNITAMLFAPVAVAYGIVIGWDVRGARRRLAACALLGLGLSAFFWVPALAERRFVRMEDVVADRYQYQQNFASLSHLWDITGEVSTPLTEDGVHLSLGGLQILLALPSLWMLASAGARRRRILFFWLLLAAGLCMTLSLSRPIWAALPPLRYVQFPWRLMGLCTLSLACLAGAGLEAVLAEGEKWRDFRPLLPLAGVALAAPSLVVWLNKSGAPTTLPLLGLTLALAAALYLASQQKVASHLAARGVVSLFCLGLCALFFLGRGERGPLPMELPRSQLTSSGWLTWERRSGFVGTTVQGEYLPRSASRQPLPPVEQRLRSVSADGVTVRTIRSWSTGLKAEVTAHKQEMLVFEQFYFPGWHAWVDDRLVRVSLGSEGLISLSVPPGRHQVEVRFGPTAVRLWATLASYLALAAAALLIAGRRRR